MFCVAFYGLFFIFLNSIVRIQQTTKEMLVRVLYSYIFVYFYTNLLSFGVHPGNIFYWVIPMNVYFRNISMYNAYIQYYGSIGEAKSIPLKLFFNFLQWNYHCQPSLVKKFYIIKRRNRVTTMAFYFCLGKIHFTRVLLCGKNWTYFARL